RLSGPKAFLRAILDRPEDPIRMNLAGAKAGVVTYRFFSDNIRLPIGVRVLSVNPPSIVVKLEARKTKEVPVRLELKNNLPEGYVLKKAEISPKVAKIRGPVSRVDAITELMTIPIDLADVRSPFVKDAEFDVARLGVDFEGAVPKVSIDVVAVQANYKIRIRGTDVQVDSPYRVRI